MKLNKATMQLDKIDESVAEKQQLMEIAFEKEKEEGLKREKELNERMLDTMAENNNKVNCRLGQITTDIKSK